LVNFGKNDFQDPYIDQNSGCLRNLLGIKNSKELSKAENAILLNRYYELAYASIDKVADKEFDFDNFKFLKPALNTSYKVLNVEYASINKAGDKVFDFDHLKAIHKHLFQDVYEWAGQIREVDVSKGETHFLHHSLIEQEAKSIFTQLKKENYLKGLDHNDFSKNAGRYLGEINRIHPFREGNWRTQREFINQLGRHNGYDIRWEMVGQKQIIEASIEAGKGNAKPFSTLIRENLIDCSTVLYIQKDQSYEGGYFRLFPAETEKKYDGKIIGVTERHVVQAPINFPSYPDHIIIHDRQSLSRTPDMGKMVEISYPRGDIGLVREPEKLKEMDSSKAHNLEKNSQQHEWER
jgi:cell filamentation protein